MLQVLNTIRLIPTKTKKERYYFAISIDDYYLALGYCLILPTRVVLQKHHNIDEGTIFTYSSPLTFT